MEQDVISLWVQAMMNGIRSTASINPPAGFHGQVSACKGILSNDITGVVNPVIEFISDVVSSIKWKIETGNENLDKILKNWLLDINSNKRKDIPVGFSSFTEEYVYEYFTSGLMLTKVRWGNLNKFQLPLNLRILDSENITVLDEKGNLEYTYSIGGKKITGSYYVRKDGRWNEEYPAPYLIKRGIYANYILKLMLKQKSAEVIKEIPLHILMGLLPEVGKVSEDADYEGKAKQLKEAMEKARNEGKTPSFFGKTGSELKHLIPDLESIMKKSLYEQIDREILSAMGLIEIIEGAGSTRRESIINAKPLMTKTQALVTDLERLLLDIMRDVVDRNYEVHKKYFKDLTKIKISHTPIRIFWDEKFRDLLRALSDRGLLSIRTTLEDVDKDYDVEKQRREKEKKDNSEEIFYPRVIRNDQGAQRIDVDEENVPLDKRENKDEYKDL